MDILTLNCGSSSVKYQLYRWSEKKVLSKGIVERVGIGGSFIDHYANGKGNFKFEHNCPDHKVAIKLIIDTLLDPEMGVIKDLKSIQGVGHRMVHGGEKFAKSVIIDDEFLKTFEALSDLAPLHNPPNLLGVRAAKELLPDIPHCAIMDTAWHQTMPRNAYIYSLPYEWYEKYRVRRYGFHGTSFLYVAKRAAVLLGKGSFDVNLIALHIGNGVSANAIKNGISIDTSMGLTPVEGLVMGTRAGDHDAGIDIYMMRKENLTVDQLDNILNKKSGILGITGKYTDRRDVEKAANEGDDRAKLAIDIETYRLKKYIGAYYFALEHVDAIIFTAGVGEMSSVIRGRTLDGLEEVGIVYDKRKNEISKTRNAETEITGEGSKVRIFVIPTDEELVFVEDTVALLEGKYDIHTNFRYSFEEPDYLNPAREEAIKSELEKKPELGEIIVRSPRKR
ncbi:MAG TPA: acetate kinase [Caldisericia bacterium]|nr:acetate kinase [Caldisericia bacterium]HPB33563.1 acetate kinase [Caldisericia bacterium]HQL67455.1 acetate kinase [Caldisericia bacterium]HQN48522.1 acetate kinase [Caldisericia bacterium]HQO99727.1 acetate kinase [Caldisericia bacterium]